ncbi:MAG: DUF5050 domain-containing protein [Myxococcales bacterium]|nr:DUF5050 domain-containing protein [Myxococcales bacterium]
MRRAAAFGLLVALTTACGAIIGTRDLTYDEKAGDGGSSSGGDGSSSSSSSGGSSSGGIDASGDGAACVADLKVDKANCGRCGHDCLGGACVDGACQPMLLTVAEEPLGITLVGDTVYFTEYFDDAVWRVKTDGTGASAHTNGVLGHAWGITHDATHLYVAARGPSDGGVYKCPLADCKGADLVKLTDESSIDIQERQGKLYFTGYNVQEVFRMGVDGTAKTSILATSSPFHLAVDDTHVYLTNNTTSLLRVPVGGGASEPVGPQGGTRAGGVFVDSTRVFWSDPFDTKASVMRSKSKAGGGPTIDYMNTGYQTVAIVADDKYVYWTAAGSDPGISSDGGVLAAPVGGGPVLTLAKSLVNVIGLAQDAKAVYFTEANATNQKGAVYKVAKP